MMQTFIQYQGQYTELIFNKFNKKSSAMRYFTLRVMQTLIVQQLLIFYSAINVDF